MTEYDYSPEAYERYLATQTRIANWVDTTEAHRREFEPALNTPPPPGAPTVKRAPAPRPSALPLQPYAVQYAPPPPRRSPSADTYEYGPGPGPMPLPGGAGYAPHPAYAPLLPPGAHQPYLLPAHRSHSHSHSHSHGHHSHGHGHGHARRHHSQGYYTAAAPPVSPPYAAPYGYPAPGGYFVVQPPPAPAHVMYLPPC